MGRGPGHFSKVIPMVKKDVKSAQHHQPWAGSGKENHSTQLVTPARMATARRKERSTGEIVGRSEPCACWWECGVARPPWKRCGVPHETRHRTTLESSKPPLWARIQKNREAGTLAHPCSRRRDSHLPRGGSSLGVRPRVHARYTTTECYPARCYHVDEPARRYASDTGAQTPHDPHAADLRSLEWSDSRRQKTGWGWGVSGDGRCWRAECASRRCTVCRK